MSLNINRNKQGLKVPKDLQRTLQQRDMRLQQQLDAQIRNSTEQMNHLLFPQSHQNGLFG